MLKARTQKHKLVLKLKKEMLIKNAESSQVRKKENVIQKVIELDYQGEKVMSTKSRYDIYDF